MNHVPNHGHRCHLPEIPAARAYAWLGLLVLSYIGVYLCRKNLAVAQPLMQREWQVTKEEIGVIASVSTVAYAIGKITFGPIVDRLGGRFCLLLSITLVAGLGLVGALSTGIASMTLCYSLNRLAGSAAWGSMVKLVPEWFSAKRLALMMGLLSLSYVFGGACASALAGLVAKVSHDNWRYIMGFPSLVLAAIAALSWTFLPRAAVAAHAADLKKPGFDWRRLGELLGNRRFLVICALSFTLTLMRETFNVWTVDFFETEGGPRMSSAIAALLATPFDVAGAVGIVLLGWLFTRLPIPARRWLLFGILGVLGVLLAGLPAFFHLGLWLVAVAIGLIGFLVYGPYSLLSGVFAVEVCGKEYAATAAGLVDGIGYFAGVLSGKYFGKLLGLGGYALGFQCLAGLTMLSAILCLFLYPKPKPQPAPVCVEERLR